MIWYSLSVSVSAGATVIESPVCTPIGSTFSIEQTMMQLSAVIADHLHLELLPAEHALLDQHLVRRRGVEPALDDLGELLPVVADAAAHAAQREGRPHDRRQADVLERPHRLLAVVGEHRLGRRKADPRHRLAEQQPVLGLGDRLGLGADHLDPELGEHACLVERQRGVERGLPAHGGQQRVGALGSDDLGDDLRRDRLDVGGVRQLRVRHDRGRIGIDQDDAVALGLQRLAGLGARIVELAGLSDDDGARADDEDGLDVRALRHDAASYCSATGLAIAARARTRSIGRSGMLLDPSPELQGEGKSGHRLGWHSPSCGADGRDGRACQVLR